MPRRNLVTRNQFDQLPISVGPGFGESVTRFLGGPGTHSGTSASCSEFELGAINTQSVIGGNVRFTASFLTQDTGPVS